MKKTLLSLLILSASSLALVNADSVTIDNYKFWNTAKTALCHIDKDKTLEYSKTGLYHGAFVTPVVLGTYRYLNSDNILKNNFTKIIDEKIVNFVQDACNKIIDHKVNIYTGDASTFGLPAGYFAAAIGDKDIIIEPSYYQVIKEYIADETKENRKEVLNIFSFLIQHEAGHLKNHDCRNRFQRALVAYLIKVCLFESSKKAYSFKASQLITYLSLNTIDTLAQGYFNRQQESRADAGVVGQGALQGGKQFFTNLINLAQTNPEVKMAMKMDLNHPTPENRLKRLQELE